MANEADFWQKQSSCLEKFKVFTDREVSDLFQRQQFEPVLLPVFFDIINRNPQIQERQKLGFEKVKDFVRAESLDGIALHRLTAENLRILAEEAKGS